MEQQTRQWISGLTEAGNDMPDLSSSPSAVKKSPYILVVTRNGHMASPLMDYALNVADRLKYRIMAAHINTLPFYRDGGRRSRLFNQAVQESQALFQNKAETRPVLVEHLVETGKIGNIVNKLCHSEKHIEFIIIDQGIRKDEVTSQASVPVFSIIYTDTRAGRMNTATYYKQGKKGVTPMSTTSRKRHAKNCLVFGALTVGLYASVFTNSEIVMTYFTKGGLYTILPVATVFAVSYLHGNFTSSFWSALGIEGSKRTTTQVDVRKEATDRPERRKDLRPRAEVSV